MLSRRQFRTGIINTIYRYELANEELNINEIFETDKDLNNEQFLQVEKISKNYSFYKKTILQFFKENFPWEKATPLVRAILLNGAHELLFIDPKIVINEAVEITKTYYGSEANLYKMVNAVLENIYKFFVASEAIERKNKEKKD